MNSDPLYHNPVTTNRRAPVLAGLVVVEVDSEEQLVSTTSENHSVFVTTPTENIGRHVAKASRIGTWPRVRANAPRQRKATAGGGAWMRVVTGAMDDPGAVTRTSAGATRMFLALPPDPTTDDLAAQWAAATVAAIRANGITHGC